tara:strand:- start:544 stop:1206 length:663 start_codon:yes stop_codon:yes gene_type:complete
MSGYALRLFEDILTVAGTATLPPGRRVVYVVEGRVRVSADGQAGTFATNNAWFGAGSCTVQAGAERARLWRWELVRTPVSDDGGVSDPGVMSRLLLMSDIELDRTSQYLMRCDRVDFPPGGIAYAHTHAGPGIRCLLRGRIEVRVGDEAFSRQPGEPWFERGTDPVLALASSDEPTSFVRAMILPRSLRGRSSIQYVRAEDLDKPKLQVYTRFADEFIDL